MRSLESRQLSINPYSQNNFKVCLSSAFMKLQECTNLQDAQQFLRGQSATFKKTVETALILKQNPDPRQRALGDGFMAAAVQELDKAEQPAEHNDKGLKTKGEHFVKEADLTDGDKSGTDGSEQSSSNSGPTKQEGTEEPVGDLGNPEMSTENQMKEGFPPMGGQPQQAPMGPPGLDPGIAQAMAPQMPQLPQMNMPQQIQQMQYTVKKYMEAYVRPLAKQVTALTKANTFLSNQIKEIQSLKTGLDLHSIRENRGVIQEAIPTTVNNIDPSQIPPRIYEKQYHLESERQNIVELDNMISNSKNLPYN